MLFVLNHPCFRIPRQSQWGVDEATKLQYRRIDRYLSPLAIPIRIHPSQTHSAAAYSYHFPLSSLFQWLEKENLVTVSLEEWRSDKHSTGSHAKRENRARSEFPLFLALLAKKQ